MPPTQLSLSWKTFKNNICDGLSSLQQREEFVDMTLAADGHFVKVHQMVISLASPYLKELIKSAPCPHPVLFLNQIPYRILNGILEYIYSGEVVVDKDDIGDLIQAGKALHIKGLEEMDWSNVQVVGDAENQVTHATGAPEVQLISPAGNLLKKRKYDDDQVEHQPAKIGKHISSFGNASRVQVSEPETKHDDYSLDDPFQESFDDHSEDAKGDLKDTSITSNVTTQPTIQYTLSNQGHIQMILNRYMYGLTYHYKNTNPPARLWKCVDNKKTKCPASVTTKDDMVVQRVGAHKHPFHDKKILKKVEAGMVLTAIKDAETKGKTMRAERDG